MNKSVKLLFGGGDMSMCKKLWFVGFALAALTAVAHADTVVLTNGARLSGQVCLIRNGVKVESEQGKVTVPSWRIAEVVRGDQAPGPQAAPQQTPPPPAVQAPQPIAQPSPQPTPRQVRPQRPSPPRVADVLTQRMTVSFDGQTAYEVMLYVREVTGVNMAIAPEVRAAQEPVHLSVEGIPLYVILDIALEPADLVYTIRPGEILYVGRRGKVEPIVRVYPVTDLLLSTEDKVGGSDSMLSSGSQGRSSGSERSGGSSPQYAAPRSGGNLSTGGAGGRGGSGNVSPLTARAENLILLIKSSCGRGTWADPYSSGLIDAASGQLPAGPQGYATPMGF